MSHETTVEIKTESGLVAVRDSATTLEDHQGHADRLRRQASAGGFVVLGEAEDPITYRLRIEHAPAPEAAPASSLDYVDVGGTFRLDAPSGTLVVEDPFAEDVPGAEAARTVELEPGTYRLRVATLAPFDGPRYTAEMKQLLGEADWRFERRVDRVQLSGCLTVLLAVPLLLSGWTRSYWWLIIPLAFVPHLIAALIRRTPRYRRIQQKQQDHRRKRPQYIFRLERATDGAEGLGGGWIPPA